MWFILPSQNNFSFFPLTPGIGVGLAYTSSQVVVAHHFKKSYSRANSIASSGVGLGIVVLPPFFQFCIEEYGWRGTLLFLAGIQAQVFVASLIFRTPKTKPSRTQTAVSSRQSTMLPDDSEALQPLNKEKDISSSISKTEMQSDGKSSHVLAHQSHLTSNNDADIKKNGCIYVNDGKQEVVNVVSYSDKLDRETESGQKIIQPNPSDSNDVPSNKREILNTTDACSADVAVDICKTQTDSTAAAKEIDTISTCIKQSTQCANGGVQNSPDVEEASKSSDEDGTTSNQKRPSRCQRFLKASGWILFKESLGFCLVIFCQISIGLCYTAIMTHFVASAVYGGVDEQSASFLLSALGIASMLARLGNGWFIHRRLIAAEHFYILAMAVFGGSTILSRAYNAFGW